MTSHEPMTTEGEFHDRLRTVVNEAAANGIDVEGAWPIVNGSDQPDWDLEIVALVDG